MIRYRHTRRDFLKLTGATALALNFPVLAESGDADPVFLKPGDADFARVHQPFNKRIGHRPAMIALCTSERGVQGAVAVARERGLPVAVRSGGHSFEGLSGNAGGLVIDLSQMDGLRQVGAHQLIAGPGCRLSRAYEFLLPKGKLIPMGSCGGVALGGLTLGGGYGMFSRKHGLTCDSLISVRLVDGKGEIHDSRDEPELLWACRGGGNGNFGVVTQLRYRTWPAPQALRSRRLRAYKLTPERAATLAKIWFEVTRQMPPETFSAFVLNGRTLTVLVTDFLDKADALNKLLAPLLEAMDKSFPVSVTPIARAVKRYYGRPAPLYFKNASAGYYRNYADIRGVAPEVFAAVIDAPGLIFQINTLGGAITTRASDGSAYPHRAYPYLGEVQSYWERPAQERRRVEGVARIRTLLAGAGVTAHYRNYPDLEFGDWAGAYYGRENYRRLQKLKQVLDPDDLIRNPQSVRLP